ncbi:related to xylosidase : arabinofuranosidase [Phialocephala subalpina]|uniref:Related to xylosidase: arabinofuranosidase n=1 Tax=Phialocephala subalpina TaxID=576137 RepID=A0A1L7X8H2_9HELO|nr:related to xylosidase : arabinofuranosidase [Phialocephala subalpina]
MKFPLRLLLIASIVALLIVASSQVVDGHSKNSTYTNPILPSWHSDPSCTFVKEWDNTAFCVTSTNAFERPSRMPELGSIVRQQHGLFAAMIQYHDNSFYVIVTLQSENNATGLIFTSPNLYDGTTWSMPTNFTMYGIDPDIFWEDDGKVYVSSNLYGTTIGLVVVDPVTGSQTTPTPIWNGTGGSSPEGPHIYKKDRYYYLMIAEGGTQLGHMETIARSTNITGPYEEYENNLILTNTNTTEYFRTVGHADLFQDESDNWWGVALATRSGQEHMSYPMGRETVLYPVTWKEGDWPTLQPVRGEMSGWPLPPINKGIPGAGAFVDDPDDYDFVPGSLLPLHFMSWRYLPTNAVIVSPHDNPHTLQINLSRANLTGDANSTDPTSFIGRRQTHTLFDFSVNVFFIPLLAEKEAGVTVFLTQYQHVDLGIVLLSSSSGTLTQFFRFRITSVWNDSSRGSSGREDECDLGIAPASIVSGGTGPYTGKYCTQIDVIEYLLITFSGALLGPYPTTNGGAGTTTAAYISEWRYEGAAQYVGNGEYVY